jgi:hypothetical protein
MDLPDKSKPEQPKKKIEPIIPVGAAVQVKRPASRRFFDFLFAESPKQLGSKIGRDIIVPRIKAGFEEAANSFLAGMLWGNDGGRPVSNIVRQAAMRGGGVNYSGISVSGNPMTQAMQASQPRSHGNYQDLTLPTQQYAEMVLANMYDLLNQYRIVAVADLYEIVNISPQPSDNAYGWTSLEGARISKVREGYLLELPRPTLI